MIDTAAIAAAATGVLGAGGLAAVLGYLRDRRVAPTEDEIRADQSVLLIQKSRDVLADNITRLQTEIGEMRVRHTEEMAAQGARHQAERAEWLADRKLMREEIDQLRVENEKTTQRLAALKDRLDGPPRMEDLLRPPNAT